MSNIVIDFFNNLYDEYGFDGVISEVDGRLECGKVKEVDTGLFSITTYGWSEDESLVHILLNPLCKFHYHYKGYIVGGVFYFTRDKWDTVDIVRV